MTDETPEFAVQVYNVLLYEPNGSEGRVHPLRAAYDALEDRSKAILTLVDGCREAGLLPADYPLAKAIKQITEYGDEFPMLRELLPKIAPEERLCLNVGPYRTMGRLAEDHDDLKRTYGRLVDDAGTVGMFAFSVHPGDAELERIIENLQTDFPLLSNCVWFACAEGTAPLSENVKKELEAGLESGSRSVVFYNRETAVLAARKATEKILAYPHLRRRTPRSMIETGFWKIGKDGEVEAAHATKNFDYYVSKYAKELQEKAVKPGGLTSDDFDLVMAGFKVESRYPDDDSRYVRVSRALQREYNYLLKIVTKL